MMIWRLLGSVLLNRRQPQTMKHELNDGKNKTDALRSDAGCLPLSAIIHS